MRDEGVRGGIIAVHFCQHRWQAMVQGRDEQDAREGDIVDNDDIKEEGDEEDINDDGGRRAKDHCNGGERRIV